MLHHVMFPNLLVLPALPPPLVTLRLLVVDAAVLRGSTALCLGPLKVLKVDVVSRPVRGIHGALVKALSLILFQRLRAPVCLVVLSLVVNAGLTGLSCPLNGVQS